MLGSLLFRMMRRLGPDTTIKINVFPPSRKHLTYPGAR